MAILFLTVFGSLVLRVARESDDWRRDVEQTRSLLPTGKVLTVSVVGTVQECW